jgi:hypothetical protein
MLPVIWVGGGRVWFAILAERVHSCLIGSSSTRFHAIGTNR